MKKAILMLVAATTACLWGCSQSADKPPTAEEKKAFEGGPMPDEWKQKMEASKNSGPAGAASTTK